MHILAGVKPQPFPCHTGRAPPAPEGLLGTAALVHPWDKGGCLGRAPGLTRAARHPGSAVRRKEAPQVMLVEETGKGGKGRARGHSLGTGRSTSGMRISTSAWYRMWSQLRIHLRMGAHLQSEMSLS